MREDAEAYYCSQRLINRCQGLPLKTASKNLDKHPPNKQEKATITVLQQAELLCKDWAA